MRGWHASHAYLFYAAALSATQQNLKRVPFLKRYN